MSSTVVYFPPKPAASGGSSGPSAYQAFARDLNQAGEGAIFEMLCIVGQELGPLFERKLAHIIDRYHPTPKVLRHERL